MTNNILQNPSAQKHSLSSCEALLAKYPLFCLLSANDIHQLALLGKIIDVKKGENITNENDIVDSFYLIVNGTAKVTRTITRVEKTEVMDIATLGPEDSIGLAETGFFSQSGVRTATVTAASPMQIIKFDLNDFHQFLHQPGIAYPGLKAIGGKILIMSFIEKVQIFSNLSKDKIRYLAEKIKKISVPTGTTLYEQGDHANECYFILQGKIALTRLDQNQIELTLSILESPSIFGENEFLHDEKRNTNAIAQTNCQLLILNREHINIDGFKQSLTQSLDILRMQKIKPTKVQQVTVSRQKTLDGGQAILLTNPNKKNRSRSFLARLCHLELDQWDKHLTKYPQQSKSCL